MSSNVAQLLLVVNTQQATINSLKSTVNNLVDSNLVLNNELKELKTMVKDSQNSHVPIRIPNSTQMASLALTDSMMKDVKAYDTKSLHVQSHRGAKTCDAVKTLKSMLTNSFGDVICHFGTNDSSTTLPVDKIMDNFREIVTEAKRVSSTGHVTISALCPRADDESASSRGREINSRLEALSSDLGFVFSSHDGNFRLQNGEANESLLHPIDKLHLSEAGVEMLLKNLQLSQLAHFACSIPGAPSSSIPRPGSQTQEKRKAPT